MTDSRALLLKILALLAIAFAVAAALPARAETAVLAVSQAPGSHSLR